MIELTTEGIAFAAGWDARMEAQQEWSNPERSKPLREAWSSGWMEADRQPNAPQLKTNERT